MSDQDPTLGIYNLLQPVKLATLLQETIEKQKAPSQADPKKISTHLLLRLKSHHQASQEALQVLTGQLALEDTNHPEKLSYKSPNKPTLDQMQAMVGALNALLDDAQLIGDGTIAENENLPKELGDTARELNTLSGEPLRRFNRALLEHAFPGMIGGFPRRLHFFDGQFLRPADLQEEQDYHRYQLRLHNRALHTPGIAEGLTAQKNDSGSINVAAGVAVDSAGNELIFLGQTDLKVDNEREVYLVFTETPAAGGLQAMDRNRSLNSVFTRWQMKTELIPYDSTQKNREGIHIFTVDRNGKIEQAPKVGIESATVLVSTLSLTDRSGDKDKYPHFTATNEVGIVTLNRGNLKIAQNLTVNGTLQIGEKLTLSEKDGKATVQVTGKGALFLNPEGGNIGIGTNIPTQMLTLQGGSLNLRSNLVDSTPSILFQDLAEKYSWRIYRHYVIENNSNLRFAGGLDANPTRLSDLMTLTHDGRLGIGTLDPQEKLHVQGALRIGEKLTVSEKDGKATVQVTGKGSLILNPEGGNIGIGTNIPTQMLTLHGGNLSLRSDGQDSTPSILFQDLVASYTWRIYRKKVGGINANLRFAGGLDADPTLLKDRMTLTHDGKLGIGTLDPQEKLHVQGALRIGEMLTVSEKDGKATVQVTGKGELTLNPEGGNVGIGTSQDAAHLTVTGRLTVNGNLLLPGNLSCVGVPGGKGVQLIFGLWPPIDSDGKRVVPIEKASFPLGQGCNGSMVYPGRYHIECPNGFHANSLGWAICESPENVTLVTFLDYVAIITISPRNNRGNQSVPDNFTYLFLS